MEGLGLSAALRVVGLTPSWITITIGHLLWTLPFAAVRNEAGQSYIWMIDGGKLVRRIVITGRRDETNGRVEIKSAVPAQMPVLAARFDNLKEGAPALVKAPTSSQNATRNKVGGAG